MFINKLIGSQNYPSTFHTVGLILGGIIFPTFFGVLIMVMRIWRDQMKSKPSKRNFKVMFDVILTICESGFMLGSCVAFNLGIILLAYNNAPCDLSRDWIATQVNYVACIYTILCVCHVAAHNLAFILGKFTKELIFISVSFSC